jgi:hypothetical protein
LVLKWVEDIMELLTELLPVRTAALLVLCTSAVAVIWALGRASARGWDHSCISPFGAHCGDGWSEAGDAGADGGD